jgi:4-oxalocrotonate tautomerase
MDKPVSRRSLLKRSAIAIEEVAPAEWTEKVYKPDIQSKWDTLYKKPGY